MAVKKVLLIDDDDLMYSTMKKTLDIFKDSLNEKVELHYVSNIRDGINLIKNKNIDFIILDYYISGETCETFLQWMNENNIKIPVDVLTSIRDYPTLRKLLTMGVGKVMYKPFDWNGIIDNINLRLVNKKKELQNV